MARATQKQERSRKKQSKEWRWFRSRSGRGRNRGEDEGFQGSDAADAGGFIAKGRMAGLLLGSPVIPRSPSGRTLQGGRPGPRYVACTTTACPPWLSSAPRRDGHQWSTFVHRQKAPAASGEQRRMRDEKKSRGSPPPENRPQCLRSPRCGFESAHSPRRLPISRAANPPPRLHQSSARKP